MVFGIAVFSEYCRVIMAIYHELVWLFAIARGWLAIIFNCLWFRLRNFIAMIGFFLHPSCFQSHSC